MSVEFTVRGANSAVARVAAAKAFLRKVPKHERRGLSLTFADDLCTAPIITRADGTIFFDGRPAAAAAAVERTTRRFAEERKAAAKARVAAAVADTRARHDAARDKVESLKRAARDAIDNHRPSWR